MKRGKTRVTKLELILVLDLIGCDGGATLLDQSQSELSKNEAIPDSFRYSIGKLNCSDDKQFVEVARTITHQDSVLVLDPVTSSPWV